CVETATGIPQCRPPSVERLTKTSTNGGLPVSGIGGTRRYEISHTLSLASYATEASLARSYAGLAGVASAVVPGRKPWTQVWPPSCEVAKPMLLAPPLKKRPTCTTETMTGPKDSESGSSSVACWLLGLV